MTAGPTIEYIDPVRVITNQSSGRTGVLLASELISAGSKVTFVYGPGIEKPPKGAKVIRVSTTKEMHDVVKKELKTKFDVAILAAAAADYTPEKPSKKKIRSTQNRLKISLKKTPKIIDDIKKYQKNIFLVGFKAEINLSKNELINSAKKKIKESKADMIIANDIGSPRYKKNPENNEVFIVDSKKVKSSGWKNKKKITKFIRKEIEEKLK